MRKRGVDPLRPESGNRSSTLEIPIEVKGLWSKLVSQAGTYARALVTARPPRQFSLVIAYNHVMHELRFLVFHAGGLTASHSLYPNKREDHENILRLVLALLTWETPGDAGLPEWCNDAEMFVQIDENDGNGVRMRVTETLYERYGIRGRGPQVSCLSPINDQSTSAPVAPVPLTTTLRRSNRVSEKARKDAGPSSEQHEKSTHRSSEKAKTCTSSRRRQDELSEIHGITLFNDRSVIFVPRRLHDLLKKINPEATKIVSKCSWVGKSHVSIESKMLRTCGGMFGVMSYYHASIVCHKKGLPVTNHLFMKTATFWPISSHAGDSHVPDFRMLIQQFSQFAGHCLVTVSQPRALSVAMVHAALASIGNVLWLNEPRTTKSVFETFKDDSSPAEFQMALKAQLRQSRVEDHCCGCVIDGDMAIELKSYFTEVREGSRSGTDEFMSDGLLEAAKLGISYMQSPVDDLWSFYYVALWAAVFNNTNFSAGTHIPAKLANLRRLIAGSESERALGTRKVTGPILDPTECGEFLVDCSPLLCEWESELLQLVQKYFPDSLSRLN